MTTNPRATKSVTKMNVARTRGRSQGGRVTGQMLYEDCWRDWSGDGVEWMFRSKGDLVWCLSVRTIEEEEKVYLL